MKSRAFTIPGDRVRASYVIKAMTEFVIAMTQAGHSQAAHPNTGKGAGIKASDLDCFPLCADRPGVRGCHPQFDQGAMFDKPTRRTLEVDWAVDTRCAIRNMGLWPATLSQLDESEA